MKSSNSHNSTWIDVATTEYPRLLFNEDANDYHGGFHDSDSNWSFSCVHGFDLDTRCVACEGLSILSGTRR